MVLVDSAADSADGAMPGDTGPTDSTAGDVAPDLPGLQDGTGNDAPIAPDGANDGATDAGSDGSSCVPEAGTATVMVYCDQMQLAVLQHGTAAAGIELNGRLTTESTVQTCAVVDSVDVVIGGTTAQTLDVGGRSVPTDGTVDFWTTGTASQPLVQMCSSDANRFDGIGLVVHGRIDGGTYTAMCGNNTGDTAWPPRVVVSCHDGLDRAPTSGGGSVMVFGSMAADQIFAMIPTPPTIVTIDAAMHVNPGAAVAFGAMPIAPFDTSGWMGSVSPQQRPDGTTDNSLSLFNNGDPLGMQVCPTPSMPGPNSPPPPVFLGRISGTTDTGTFTSEVFVSTCVRM